MRFIGIAIRSSEETKKSEKIKTGYKEWEKKYDQIKYCRNCLSDDIEEIYLEIEYGVPTQALKVCRSCGTKIAEYKS